MKKKTKITDKKLILIIIGVLLIIGIFGMLSIPEVNASKQGYAMKNNESKAGTVVGKAFDSCDKKECKILMIVAH